MTTDIDGDIAEVINAAKAGRIVYFFGAGVSAGVQGLPNGTKLSEWFTEQLWRDGKLEEPPDRASHDENSRYYDDLGDVCEELQLSSQLYEQAFGRPRLVEILAEQYGRVEPALHGLPHIYDRIIQCVKRKKEAGQETQPTIFFTTNFDNLLELTLERHGVEYDLLLHERMANPAKPPDFHYRQNSSLKTNNNFERIDRLSPPNIPNKNPLVIKLHGCLQERCVESGREKIPLTVTDQDYLSPSLYKLHEFLPVSIRLKLLDNDWLFFGYSFKDLHVRLFIRHLYQFSPSKRVPRIFAMSRGSNLLKTIRKSQGIQMIPYQPNLFTRGLCGSGQEEQSP